MRSNKFGLLSALVGLALAVVLFIVLSKGGDDSEPTPATTTPTVAEEPAGETREGGEEARKQPKPKPKPELPRLVIRHGEPVGGPLELKVRSGERIRFEVKADEPDELHLHGYDQYIDVGPGKPTKVDIKATIEGIFELESHHTGALLAKISVVPS
jgi:hypothetical protein